ncbi:unnamed protein product [Pedinophyceae sp. YPF-701]|nr:unnamed protein product [Pedinophyceae sp. YPF-701]
MLVLSVARSSTERGRSVGAAVCRGGCAVRVGVGVGGVRCGWSCVRRRAVGGGVAPGDGVGAPCGEARVELAHAHVGDGVVEVEVGDRHEDEAERDVVEAVRGERVRGAEDVVEVVRPEVVPDEGEDRDEDVRLDPPLRQERLRALGLVAGRQEERGDEARQSEAAAHEHVAPLIEVLVQTAPAAAERGGAAGGAVW